MHREAKFISRSAEARFLRRHHRLFALFLGGLALSSGAMARKEEPYVTSAPTIVASPLALAIASFDRNGDLQVTRAEYDAEVLRSFAGGDRDGDGFMGLIELSAWASATLGNATALPGAFDFDRDGDDKISRAEFVAYFGRQFTALDVDRDGKLVRSELVQLIATPQRDGKRGRRGDPTPPSRPQQQPQPR